MERKYYCRNALCGSPVPARAQFPEPTRFPSYAPCALRVRGFYPQLHHWGLVSLTRSARPGHVGQGDSPANVIDHVGSQACRAEHGTPDVWIACRECPHRIVWVLDDRGHRHDEGVECLRRKVAELPEDPLLNSARYVTASEPAPPPAALASPGRLALLASSARCRLALPQVPRSIRPGWPRWQSAAKHAGGAAADGSQPDHARRLRPRGTDEETLRVRARVGPGE